MLPEEEETASPLSGMKFLCAEDNAINAEILEMLLESKGAHCKIYPNGQEIVDAFASVKPHGNLLSQQRRPLYRCQ